MPHIIGQCHINIFVGPDCRITDAETDQWFLKISMVQKVSFCYQFFFRVSCIVLEEFEQIFSTMEIRKIGFT